MFACYLNNALHTHSTKAAQRQSMNIKKRQMLTNSTEKAR